MKSSQELENKIVLLKEQTNLRKLHVFFKEKNYLPIFIKQLNALLINIHSIEVLIENSNYEDAFTILRKYMETYFIVSSIIKHPELTSSYLIHDKYIGKKACGVDLKSVKNFREGKPDGFLEYGYLEPILSISDGFKYTARTVADAGDVSKFFTIYKTCNNFVHNNLSSVNVRIDNANNYLETSISNTLEIMLSRIDSILK